MEIAIGVVGVLLTILIALVPYLKKKYGERPKLEIEIIYDSVASRPVGLSSKNDNSKGYIDANDAIRIFELTCKMKLIIRNNSDIAAYYTKMHYEKQSIVFDKLPTKPILNSGDISLQGEYKTSEECRGQERTTSKEISDKLSNLKIVLEYQNNHGTNFYTIYNHGQDEIKNTHLTKRPKELSE